MDSALFKTSLPTITDVYTDLNSLQGLRNEKNNDEALKKVAQQFEGIFINLLLKNMRSANAVFEQDSMFQSKESEFFRDMHDNQLALTLAHGRGFGIADAMYRQLSRNYGDADQAPTLREVTRSPASVNLPQQAEPAQAITPAAPSEKIDVQEESSSIPETPLQFVQQVYKYAAKAAKKLGVDAETLVAQAALETGWGKHVFTKANGESTHNLFNIKSSSSWQGDEVSKNTLEFYGEKFVPVKAMFRSYSSLQESFEDFSSFILGNQRYQSAVEDSNDGMEFIRGIHEAGYATDPNYAEKIESVYERVKDLRNAQGDEL